MGFGKSDKAGVVPHVREVLTRSDLLARVDVRVVPVRDQRIAERAPCVRDASCATDVDEHERTPIEHSALAQEVRHRRLQDQSFHTCSLAAMAEERAQQPVDPEQLVAGLRKRLDAERAGGAYADDLSGFELEKPDIDGPRVRFRPELGFSSKPVVGPPITWVKRLLLRLQLYVFDDLARQADEAIQHAEHGLAVEVANRERLEDEVRELEARIRSLEEAADAPRQRRAR
jgi:hypothetical protein